MVFLKCYLLFKLHSSDNYKKRGCKIMWLVKSSKLSDSLVSSELKTFEKILKIKTNLLFVEHRLPKVR